MVNIAHLPPLTLRKSTAQWNSGRYYNNYDIYYSRCISYRNGEYIPGEISFLDQWEDLAGPFPIGWLMYVNLSMV